MSNGVVIDRVPLPNNIMGRVGPNPESQSISMNDVSDAIQLQLAQRYPVSFNTPISNIVPPVKEEPGLSTYQQSIENEKTLVHNKPHDMDDLTV